MSDYFIIEEKNVTVYNVYCKTCKCSLHTSDREYINEWLEQFHTTCEDKYGELDITNRSDVCGQEQRTGKIDQTSEDREEEDNSIQARSGFTVLTGVGCNALWG
jgi:hypothetical protein